MTTKKMIKIALAVALFHFTVTSAIGYYIAIQIGSQAGQIVAGGLAAASDRNNKDEPERIYQDMKSHVDKISAKWQIPELAISLPAKPVMNVILKDIIQNQINKLITKEISRKQFRTQGLLIDYSVTAVNSLAFGLLLYWILNITIRKITTGSSPTRDTRASGLSVI